MRELGINVEETAIMSAVSPAIAILMPPLAGMIADKIGNFRVSNASCIFCNGGGSALLLLLVPVGRITLTFPESIVLGVICPTDSSPILSVYREYSCISPNPDDILETEIRLESCGFACQAVLNKNYTNQIVRARSYDIKIYNTRSNSTLNYGYTLSVDDVHEPEPISKSRNHKRLKSNQRYLTSIRKLSKNSYYFPTNSMYNFSCDIAKRICALGSREQFQEFNRMKNPWAAGLKPQRIERDDFDENRQFYTIKYLQQKNISHFTCLNNSALNDKHITVTIPLSLNNSRVKHLDLGSCSQRCIATVPRHQICSNDKTTLELDMALTFWTYLCIRVFVGIVSGTSFAMFEGAVIAILREHKADYGLQRIYATIGGMISSPISGWMIDFASVGKGYTDFRPIFFLYAALKIVSGVLMLFINLEFKKAATSVVSDVITVLKKIELIALFLSCLILGCAWGFIESFLFWLLEDLGRFEITYGFDHNSGRCGWYTPVGTVRTHSKKVGPRQSMESITFGLSFTAAVTYAAKLSTVTTDTSIQGMLGGLYYGVGKGVGSLVGGYLIKPIGIRHTFQVFAIVVTVVGFIYFGFYHIYMKKNPSQGIDITKKEKTPESFNDVNIKSKAEVAELQADLPVVYEDAMCNPAYETTEIEEGKYEMGSAEKSVHYERSALYS
ncbi:hypothetical protein NQ317_007135 [Molorchus minor]|uniref:Major facilitator superfamily associated domain-containing protein n=1 Tax=Molorchus minor TaxID=1323400 RepID=A0ABQ9K0G1_9CUCU|nr:hypothetical protein NQ317_007135 [Molorchus minor]